MIAYGPVPSRRLGQSLGINHIPPKICSYSCIYCQLGSTIKMQSDRSKFYPPNDILKNVEEQLSEAKKRNERVNYLTFVPDGEPTLDLNLGREINLLKSLDIKIAVIQNSSLLWREDVRNDLYEADWVSLKVDAITEKLWRRINRPHKDLKLEEILEGIREFSQNFCGELASETMMINNFNDDLPEINKIANFLGELEPDKAYVAIPTRPPAEKWVKSADETSINQAYQIFKEELKHVEYLIGYEGNAFAFSGNIEKDLLSITSVHPMREEGVNNLLTKAGSDWNIVKDLIKEGKLIELKYLDKKFYMRKIPSRRNSD